MGRSELLVSTPTSPSFMDLSLEPTMPKTPPLFIFESPYQVQVESFHLSSWTVNGNGLDMLPMAFFLQDDHERVENDQEQLLDAIDEHTFFLKGLNTQLNEASSWFGNGMGVSFELSDERKLVFDVLVLAGRGWTEWRAQIASFELDGSDESRLHLHGLPLAIHGRTVRTGSYRRPIFALHAIFSLTPPPLHMISLSLS
ncbi:hypothetical protein YC2023_010919 [Brassica napus]